MRTLRPLLALGGLAALLLLPGESKSRVEVDYARDVAPILEQYCFDCHGDRRQRSGLRIDRRENLFSGGDSGVPGIVPGRRDESEIYLRLIETDEELRMPQFDEPLPAEAIETLGAWIDQGAPWPEDSASSEGPTHWAYLPVERPDLPAVEREDWCRNEIDRFILGRLEAQGLTPSPEAERATLIRRLSLDLLGLPPTSDEVRAFVQDASPDAYDVLVERLLASPHFGERWGRHWLDLARYSDSHGYTFDGARSMWPYRDWVIEAFNRDLPFDRFTIDQLAGDLVDDPSTDQLVATGFHRNTQINEENGVDPEEDRVEAIKDRVDTTGTVWLGSTLNCAQCHSHKYDPFTQRDYYRLFAFFNQSEDTGGYVGTFHGPKLELPTPQEAAEIERIESTMEPLRARLEAWTPEMEQAQRAWEREYVASADDWERLAPRSVEASEGELSIQDDGSVLAEAGGPPRATYQVVLDRPEEKLSAVRLDVLADPRAPKAGPGRSAEGNFVLTEFRLAVAPLGDAENLSPVELTRARASHFQDLAEDNRWPVEAALDGESMTGWAILPHTGRAHAAVFELAQPLSMPGGMRLVFTLEQHFGERHTIGHFALSASSDPPGLGTYVTKDRFLALARTPVNERSAAEEENLRRLFLSDFPELNVVRQELAALEKARPRPVTTLVMEEKGEARTTHLLKGGSFLSPGIELDAGVPEFLPPLGETGDTVDRLDLARWLVDARNPLTHRVLVNRAWQRLFGLGIVETEDDFGTRGARPTHPELIDWLADAFLREGQSFKGLIRRIVHSATYRQSSAPRPRLEEVDPRNRLLARQSRLRCDAETLRDSCLVASGLLSRKMGGPPVYPPQPEGVFRFTQTPKNWRTSEGEDRYRRTLYTWHWRSSPYPFLTTFDADLGKRACTRRRPSNTPLQALTLANDPMIVELAGGLALRALGEGEIEPRERLRRAFRWCLVREPEADELNLLEDFLQEQLEAFEERPDGAADFAPLELPAGVDVVQAAAWTQVGRLLFNLDEFVTRS